MWPWVRRTQVDALTERWIRAAANNSRLRNENADLRDRLLVADSDAALWRLRYDQLVGVGVVAGMDAATPPEVPILAEGCLAPQCAWSPVPHSHDLAGGADAGAVAGGA